MRNALVAKKPARPTTSPMLTYRYFTTSEQGDAMVARAVDPYLQGTALAELVKLELAQIAQTSSKKSLIIDFQNVKMIGSSVISSLLGVKRQVVSHDKSLRLCGMSKSLRHVFKTLNMDGTVFDIFDSVEEAIQGVSRPTSYYDVCDDRFGPPEEEWA